MPVEYDYLRDYDLILLDDSLTRSTKNIMALQVSQTLDSLTESLEISLSMLRGAGQKDLEAALHNHDRLPEKELAAQAAHAVDLLHATEQLLSPGPLILADHFLGELTFRQPLHGVNQFIGYVSSKCLVAAVELNVADTLGQESMTIESLAAACNARPDRLRQVLRILHNNAIFSYNKSTNTYSNNSTSELLRSEHWTQWRNWVDLYGNEFYNMACGIPAACRKDAVRMPAQIHFDTDDDMFTFFAAQGWVPKLHKTLGGGAKAQAPGILEDYPWGELEGSKFLDVGGGVGGMVAEILRKHKDLRAGILDTPKIIDLAKASFHTPGGQFSDVGEQVLENDLIAGDFLVEIPTFEVYTMKWCLHDWDDSKALKIMTNIRKAIFWGPKSRLIILESLLTDGRMGRLSRYGDIIMWMSANGQERSEQQWTHLAKETGWLINRIYPLRNAWPCAIELLPDRNYANGDVRRKGANEPVTKSTTPWTVPSSELQDQVIRNGEITKRIAGPGMQVSSTMRFLEPWDAPSKGNPFIRSEPAPGFDYMNFGWQDEKVIIRNARPLKDSFRVEKHGFAFLKTKQDLPSEVQIRIRANDKSTIQEYYYPQVKTLVQSMTGAERVIIFDHTLRKRDVGRSDIDNPTGTEQPATMVCALNTVLEFPGIISC